MPAARLLPAVLAGLLATALVPGCSSIKYDALEKVGIYKRDLLVGDVKDARDAQQDAQQEFKDALERFGSIVEIKETGLKKAYDRFDGDYESAKVAAQEVSERIDDVEDVADDLFDEWADENDLYTDAALRRDSEATLRATRERYKELLATMKESEASMKPVLDTLRNNVLYLKHNLNAQAIGSLRGTFSTLQGDVDRLVEQMNLSIERSNQFISELNRA